MKKQLLLAAAMILSVGGLSTCGNGRLSEFRVRSSEKTVKKTESKETQPLKKVLAAPESQANPAQVAAKRRSIRQQIKMSTTYIDYDQNHTKK